MRKSNVISTVLAVALCTLTASAGMIGLGSFGVKKSSVLSDLTGVHVTVVLRNPKELEKYSSIFTQQHLRTKVESILSRRHIRLLSEDELTSVPGKPVLEVRMNSAIDKQLSLAVIKLEVRLVEDVSLARNDLRARAATSLRSRALLVNNFEEFEFVAEVVEKLINSFCDRYDKANPRPGIDTKD